MNNILDNLFYKEKLGIGNKATFIKNVRKRHPEIKIKDIQEYLKNQEVNQINTTVNQTYKISAPPRTFQIDIFWWRRGDTLIPISLLVDILSRKAWAYEDVLCNGHKDKVLNKGFRYIDSSMKSYEQSKRGLSYVYHKRIVCADGVTHKTIKYLNLSYVTVMNNILDNLFYTEKLGIGNNATFIKNVRERHPEIKIKEIQEYLKNQEVNQINTTVNKKYEYKITAPPRTFQIDIFWWRRGDTLIPILLLVDILSRKAWAYVLTKSKQEKRADVSVKTLQEFQAEVGFIKGLEGDNEFSSAAIKKFCEDNNIRLDTSVSKEEHISNGNKLGIIDRLVRTLRELIEKYFDITGHRTDNIKDVIATVIATYNSSSHRTLKNKSPNQVFKDNDD